MTGFQFIARGISRHGRSCSCRYCVDGRAEQDAAIEELTATLNLLLAAKVVAFVEYPGYELDDPALAVQLWASSKPVMLRTSGNEMRIIRVRDDRTIAIVLLARTVAL